MDYANQIGRGQRGKWLPRGPEDTQHQVEDGRVVNLKASHLGEEGVGLHTCDLIGQPHGCSCRDV